MNTSATTAAQKSVSTRKRPPRSPDWKDVLLRMPMKVVAHIDAAASANYRSRTAEINARLEASMEGESFDAHGVIVRIRRRPSSEGPRP